MVKKPGNDISGHGWRTEEKNCTPHNIIITRLVNFIKLRRKSVGIKDEKEEKKKQQRKQENVNERIKENEKREKRRKERSDDVEGQKRRLH